MKFSPLDSYSLLENLQVGVVVHDSNTEILYANPKALTLLRITENQALGRDAFDQEWQFLDHNKKIISPEYYPVNQVISSNKLISNIEIGICDSSNDQITWVLCTAYPERTPDEKISKVIVTFIDITNQKKEISFENIVELADDIIIVTDSNTSLAGGPKIVFVNEAFTKYTGYSKSEALGKSPGILQGKDTSCQTRKEIKEALNKQSSIKTQILNYTKLGKPYWLDMAIFPLKNTAGEVTHFAAIERDITIQKNNEIMLRELSIRDPLTTLLNRRGFFEIAQSTFTLSKRNNSQLVIAMIDIDYFKNINDRYGHHIGDLALQHLSLLMQTYFRTSDIIARIGGEEFAILMSNADINFCHDKLNSFLNYLSETPFKPTQNEHLAFTISVGLAQIKEDTLNFSDTLKLADIALYDAKNKGRNRISIHS